MKNPSTPSTGSAQANPGQVSKTWHDWYVEERTAGERIADRITAFVGSWLFVYLHIVWFGAWVMLPVELFPFGLLTMLVSLEAILLSTFIMMSQNRQVERDRRQAKADYDTNVAAKLEIEDLQRMLYRIETEKLGKILTHLGSRGDDDRALWYTAKNSMPMPGAFDIQTKLAKRATRVGDSAIRKMMVAGSKVPGAISLAQGIPEAKTPEYIREGVIELLRESTAIGKYTLGPGLPELRKIVADKLSVKSGHAVDPDKHLCITAGAIEALAITMSSIVEEGDEVILMDPGYPPYIPQVLFNGGKPVLVPLQADGGWKIDFEKLKAAVSPKTKALIVCNPSNPTGMVMSKEELAVVAELAARHGFFIIADLTYDFLVYDGTPVPSFLEFPEIRDRLIIVYSFSKEFSMTGWRSGYLFAPEEVVAQALKVHDMFLLCAPTISQYAAIVAFSKSPSEDHLTHHAEMEEKRDLTCARLDRLSGLFSYEKPHGAYYIIAKYKKPDIGSWDFAMRLLNEAKVIVVPGIACGSQGEGHIRFSYGASKEKINEAFDRIEKWAATLQ